MDMLSAYLGKLHWKVVLVAGARVLLVLVLARVALALVRSALNRFEKRLVARAGDEKPDAAQRASTLTRLARQAAAIVLYLVALLTVLSEVGIDIKPVLASAGIAGLAVGFGAQNLVRDVISGFFLVLEDQINVGDVAVVNGTGGLVEKVNLRTVVLRDLAGVVHVFPNGSISKLSNMTQEWSAYVFEIGVAYKQQTDEVVEVLKEVGAALRQDEEVGPNIIEEMEIFGVDKFAESAVVIKGRIKTKPIKQWVTGREFLRRVKLAFDARGIEIPFPHRSIYFGESSKPFLTKLAEDEPRG